MRAMLISFVAMFVIAVGASYALHRDEVPFSAADRTTSSDSVRLN